MGSKVRRAGGSATGGGMNFQAAVTAIATIYMARGRPLMWLDKLIDDTPVAVEAETGGAGDDIRLFLKGAKTVEVQAKKGLRSGADLWGSLLKLASAVTTGAANFGVLAVSPSSSATVKEDLANDLIRIGNGRVDGLSDIAKTFMDKLAAARIKALDACARLRIQTVPALAADQAAIQAARAELAHVCATDADTDAAWKAIYTDASAQIEQRGRRDVASVLRLLRAEGIAIASTAKASPIQLLSKLSRWTLATHATFTIFGVDTPLKTDEDWIPLSAVVRDDKANESTSLEEALRRYQEWETRSAPRGARSVNPETLGRFVTRTVLVAGPGMGKTTLLKRVARRYSEDQIPVLLVRLSAVAARIRAGFGFEEAVFELGLDGSGISVAEARDARFPNWMLLCDGLDECGSLQEQVAAGLARFAQGHPDSRILITTRPIGYNAAHFKDWRHYDIFALDTSAAHRTAAQLIEATAPPGSELSNDAFEICRRELSDRPIAKVVGRTPLLIGLSVAILLRGRELGATRERVFAQIFDLIGEAPNARSPEPPAPPSLLRRFLDILGWQITSHPLATIKETIDRCALDLAADMGTTRIAAVANAERFLDYWQNVGVVERVGQGGQQTLSFIHKSFGEFAAAHYLRTLPATQQPQVVREIADSEAWSEVLRLAGMLGMADILAAQLRLALPERLVLATELVAEADPPPSRPLRVKLLEQAFAIMGGTRQWLAFDIGKPLIASARRFPDEVGAIAATYLEAREPWSRLIAWACTVAAGPRFYDLDDLVGTLRDNIKAVGPTISSSLGGGVVLARGDEHALAEAFVLEASEEILDRAPAQVADALLQEVFNYDNLGSVGFMSKAMQLADAKGRNYQIGKPEWSKAALSWLNFPAGFHEASRNLYQLIFEALDLPPDIAGADAEPLPPALLHLSAFIDASGMNKVAAGDFWSWSEPFDRNSIIAALRGFVAATGLDRDKLCQDAVLARRYLETKKDRFIYDITTNVDAPPMDWTRARSLGLDAMQIETAITHPSHWLKWIAANLLGVLLEPAELQKAVERLFATGRRRTLWGAAALAEELGRDLALPIVLDRLAKPLVPGCEYLFELLEDLKEPWSPDVEAAIRTGLFAADVDTAKAAAKLALALARPGIPKLADMIDQAYAYWLKHEEPYPTKGGVIPASPRANLAKAGARLGLPSYETIKNYLSDERSDIYDIGARLLVERLQQPHGERLQFFNEVEAGEVQGRVVDKVLASGVRLDAEELTAAERLLVSADKVVRYCAMALLHERYMGTERIQRHAERMSADSEHQIRNRALSKAVDGGSLQGSSRAR
ncbi:hypothetical protein NKI44_16440 [Mesorhizobium sp. M0614]|uniref:NACHT domain-containing protein n=1 Tax=Mesorhizobium sp. M0614 TaxID=2956970 RepID=UPI00333641ED